MQSNSLLMLLGVAAGIIVLVILVMLAARIYGRRESKPAAPDERTKRVNSTESANSTEGATAAIVDADGALAGGLAGGLLVENGTQNEQRTTFASEQALAAEPQEKAPSLKVPALAAVEFRTGRRTDVGRVRELNEDSLLTIETARITTSIPYPAGVYVVADGMGGHSAGEVASTAIVNYIQSRCLGELGSAVSRGGVDWLAWVKETIEQANAHVFEMRKASGSDMGSTLVMAMLDGPRAYIAHVGDSRAYRINESEIRRLTIDHSLVERLVAIGQIRPEEAQTHPQRNVIYRTIGDKAHCDTEGKTVDLAVGDRLLLCSDGLSGMLTDTVIHKTVTGAADPQSACEALVAAANAAGGDDNISVIIVQIVLA